LGITLDPGIVQAYQRDGAVVIRGLFDPNQIKLLESGIEQNLSDPSNRAATLGNVT
jgi:hypothetical protein